MERIDLDKAIDYINAEGKTTELLPNKSPMCFLRFLYSSIIVYQYHF